MKSRDIYHGIDIDAFQIMPNHIHGIIVVGAAPVAARIPNARIMGNHGGGGCPYEIVVAGCGSSFQNNDDQMICGRRKTPRISTVPREIMVTQLLGTYCS